MKTAIYISFILFTINANAQLWNNVIIKTHPLRNVFAYNPNLGIEKIVSKHFSVELEYTFKNRDINFRDCEPTFIKQYNSNGFRVLTGAKYYFFLGERIIPNSWYVYLQSRYSMVNFNEYVYCAGDNMAEALVSDIYSEISLNLLFGRQFKIYKKLFTEFNLGIGTYSLNYKRYFSDSGKLDYEKNYNNRYRFYINWTIGYLISKNKK